MLLWWVPFIGALGDGMEFPVSDKILEIVKRNKSPYLWPPKGYLKHKYSCRDGTNCASSDEGSDAEDASDGDQSVNQSTIKDNGGLRNRFRSRVRKF